jgi:hypothetical protein
MSAGLLAGCGAQASVAKGPDSAPAAPAAVRPDMTYRKGDLIKRRGNQQMAVA